MGTLSSYMLLWCTYETDTRFDCILNDGRWNVYTYSCYYEKPHRIGGRKWNIFAWHLRFCSSRMPSNLLFGLNLLVYSNILHDDYKIAEILSERVRLLYGFMECIRLIFIHGNELHTKKSKQTKSLCTFFMTLCECCFFSFWLSFSGLRIVVNSMVAVWIRECAYDSVACIWDVVHLERAPVDSLINKWKKKHSQVKHSSQSHSKTHTLSTYLSYRSACCF